MRYKPANKKMVYVGRFNHTITKKYLNNLFSQFGSIKRVWKSFEYPTQYAFIHFKDKFSASEAIRNFDGKKIKGRSVKVKKPREYFPDCTLRNDLLTSKNPNNNLNRHYFQNTTTNTNNSSTNRQCFENTSTSRQNFNLNSQCFQSIKINTQCLLNSLNCDNENESNKIAEITICESDNEENDIIEMNNRSNDENTFLNNNKENSTIKINTLNRSQLELNLKNNLSKKRPVLVILDSPSKPNSSKKICIRNDESLNQSFHTITID